MSTTRGPVSQFIEKNYLHFNAAALMDAAKGYETHLLEGGKMMVTLAGAMSTAELGISLAEMIRQGKIDIISCTGAGQSGSIVWMGEITGFATTLISSCGGTSSNGFLPQTSSYRHSPAEYRSLRRSTFWCRACSGDM